MSRIRGRDTKPEIIVRKWLWREGFRYRLNVHSLPGTPDIVLRKHRTVVFVNGCFWHGHRGCKDYVAPKSNRKFWQEKIERNIRRDEVSRELLEALGWTVETVWECELKADRRAATLSGLAERIRSNGQAWKSRRFELLVDKSRNALRLKEAKERYDAVMSELVARIPESVLKESLSDSDDWQ